MSKQVLQPDQPAGRPIPTDPEALLSTEEVAWIRRQSPRTIEKERLTGGGCPFVKLGRSVRYRRQECSTISSGGRGFQQAMRERPHERHKNPNSTIVARLASGPPGEHDFSAVGAGEAGGDWPGYVGQTGARREADPRTDSFVL